MILDQEKSFLIFYLKLVHNFAALNDFENKIRICLLETWDLKHLKKYWVFKIL